MKIEGVYSDIPGEKNEKDIAEGSDEDLPFIGVRHRSTRRTYGSPLENPLYLSCFTFLMITIGFIVGVIGSTVIYHRSSGKNIMEGRTLGTFATGFKTEFGTILIHGD
jgi:hypothetical protein